MNIEIMDDERLDDLNCKNLKILQKKDGFCFGMDSVLIANFVKISRKSAIVADLGTGTGIISILVVGKQNPKKVYAVEIQEELVDMAKRSVKYNDLEDKIDVINADIVGISIATRPDCLGEEVLTLLSEIHKIKPVFVELGLQTIHEKTADYIRRGYPLEEYDSAVKKLHAINANVVTHLILGLPGESEEMILDSVKYVANAGSDGIKLQLLHILKGTDLYEEYLLGKVKTMELSEYTELICKCLKVLPDDIVIHRLTGDGDKRILAAPMWSADKKRVLNTLKKATDKIE